MIARNKRLIIILGSVVFLLLVPLIAMQFTDEVEWTGLDFLVMGILLLGTGLIIELILRNVKENITRIIVISFVLLIFLLVWAELAVGIFGTPFAGS